MSSGNWRRQALVAAFTAAALATVVVLGQVPLGRGGGRAVLRVALRTVQSNARICIDRTAEELEAIPRHMRQARICEDVAPPYRLRIAIDGGEVLEELFQPGGLRGDRPLTVDRQIDLLPGAARLDIRFSPEPDARLAEALAAASATLPSYRLETAANFVADRILLVTLNDASGKLEVYGGD